jgi:N-acetyl-anhydromuramyl-L-alanine amidase AmpD
MKKHVLVFVLTVSSISFSQEPDRSAFNTLFNKAAQEFNVPADVLKGISFAETRWSHLTWPVGDTASACNGMPRPYGIMSLWDNNHFGHSLREAAALLGKSPDELKNDPFENIRGAAALLRKFYNELPKPEGTDPSDIESWRNAIAAYSGLPQIEYSQQHALDIYTQMARGYHQFGIDWEARRVNLELMRAAVAKIQEEAKTKTPPPLRKTADQPDYPLAKWAQAADGHWYTSGFGDYFVVIHDMEGYYLSVISYFQDPATQASAHFCINSLQNGPGENRPGDTPAGEITQMIELKYWAWHVVCWNRYMVGIEHEGFVNTAVWYSNEMYNASAKLTKWLCDRFGIPKDRNHIIAHSEWQNATWRSWLATNFPAIDPYCYSGGVQLQTHTDPGPFWNWTLYMGLITSDTLAPKIASVVPAQSATNVPAYKDVVISFTSPMDIASTNSAFSITPTIVGSLAWNADSKVLTFHATNFFAFSTTYTVKINGAAKGAISGKGLDGNGDGVGGDPYQFSFTTAPVDTTGAVVVESYPRDGEINVSLFADVKVTLNEPITQASLAGRVFIEDSTGISVSFSNGKYETLADRGVISLTPTKLQRNKLFRIKLLAGLKDLYNNDSKSNVIIPFRTTLDTVLQGSVVDYFETNASGWLQPGSATGSSFIDSTATSFLISTDKKKSGSNSGKLSYVFSQNQNGVVVLKPTTSPSLDAVSTLGLWVYGDDGNDTLAAGFQPLNQTISFGPVNWYGWRFLTLQTDQLTGSGKKLSSLLLSQTVLGAKQGVIYFDDMQTDPTVTSGVSQRDGVRLDHFSLEQNYPNPFNPTTNLRFTTSELRFVSLKVYDMLGREVSTLVHQTLNPGVYSSEWNASMVSSGIYYYKLTAGEFSSVKKMVLLK